VPALDNRVTVVTGSSRGLGEGIARGFAAEGALVVCADVLDASSVAASLPPSPVGKSYAVKLDVSDASAVQRVVDEIVRSHGRLDVFVNNAGVAQPVRALMDTDDETIDRVLRVNLRGVINGCRSAGKIMRSQGSGKIINVASEAGKHAWPGWAIYSASKAAVISITQSLALELAPYNVVVNCICPGTMETDMTRSGFADTASQSGQNVESLFSKKVATIPLARLGRPSDIAAMATWIASDECSYTTGAAFNLTGGQAIFF
jgi:NAD(P)-dependent dehydrogenase (short-subunit alcohol dehydrogenase family)